MVSSSHSWPPPLLSWKGIQLWSVGTRAPSLCRAFVSSSTPSFLRLLKLLHKPRPSSAPPPASSPPHRHSLASSSPPIPPLPACLRRNSDASAPHRLSTSSYERVSLDYHTPPFDLPRILKLGSSPLQSSSSRAESSFASSSSRFMGSPSLLSSKLKGTCSRILNAAQQNNPHISDLFTGNQFLLHVTAAPVSNAGGNDGVRPSVGLVDASLRCRESELKDRIVFFL